MQLNERGAWARAYLLSWEVWERFKGSHRPWGDKPTRTDLCTMLRTIFVWMPLAVVANVAAATGIVLNVCIFLWQASGHISLIAAIAALIIGLAIFVAACIYAVKGTKRVVHSETVRIFAEYAAAKKRNFCPTIIFGDNT